MQRNSTVSACPALPNLSERAHSYPSAKQRALCAASVGGQALQQKQAPEPFDKGLRFRSRRVENPVPDGFV